MSGRGIPGQSSFPRLPTPGAPGHTPFPKSHNVDLSKFQRQWTPYHVHFDPDGMTCFTCPTRPHSTASCFLLSAKGKVGDWELWELKNMNVAVTALLTFFSCCSFHGTSETEGHTSGSSFCIKLSLIAAMFKLLVSPAHS
ncbi:hypothetical protein NDU88_006670 [Pleurodeles waltl]|uniref:Uncharacterized protein n=1 Tax=Pleurodeles waltl TaxID=8319 RepID=A0AAV7N4Q3_PLEWA|nr:hypothetical protein NDU88_006670 [Pleurodeles waltl]